MCLQIIIHIIYCKYRSIYLAILINKNLVQKFLKKKLQKHKCSV